MYAYLGEPSSVTQGQGLGFKPHLARNDSGEAMSMQRSPIHPNKRAAEGTRCHLLLLLLLGVVCTMNVVLGTMQHKGQWQGCHSFLCSAPPSVEC